MNAPSFLGLGYQKTLIFAALDYFSASDVLPDTFGGQFGQESALWKESVIEFLRKNIAAGFIGVASAEGNFNALSNSEEILKILSQSNPNENSEIWMGIRFAGTEKLISLVSAHGILNWDSIRSDLNIKFIEAIYQAYVPS